MPFVSDFLFFFLMAFEFSRCLQWRFVLLILSVPVCSSIPFVVFHGASESCADWKWQRFTLLLTSLSGSPGSCVEIGNGGWDSIFMPLNKQVQIACDKVKQMPGLKKGFNVVGLSQGNLITRGLIEFCDGAPPVKNYVSLAGPHAGTAAVPKCLSGTDGPWCPLLNKIVKDDVYKKIVQDSVGPAGYVKFPDEISEYLSGSMFLPYLNNEKPNARNATYKTRFSSLQSLTLIMFESDHYIIPRETSWFGYYPDGAYQPVIPVQKTKLYTEDWIGLKALDRAGKVKHVKVPGEHLEIADEDVKKYVIPHLKSK